jgi:folate-dependent tRNA-U54 methylase TrmFO/GidA
MHADRDKIFEEDNFKILDEHAREFLQNTICYDKSNLENRYRWSAQDCLDSQWIKNMTTQFVRELTEANTDKIESLTKYKTAKSCMNSLT